MFYVFLCHLPSVNFSPALEPLRSVRHLYTVLHLRGTAQPGGAGGFLAHWTVGGTLTKKTSAKNLFFWGSINVLWCSMLCVKFVNAVRACSAAWCSSAASLMALAVPQFQQCPWRQNRRQSLGPWRCRPPLKPRSRVAMAAHSEGGNLSQWNRWLVVQKCKKDWLWVMTG